MKRIWIEIKSRIAYIALAETLLIILSFSYKETLLILLSSSYSNLHFLFTHPTEPLICYIYLSSFFSLFFIFPFFLFHLYSFFLPAFFYFEYKRFLFLCWSSILLFTSSSLLFITFLFPTLLGFFVGFNSPSLLSFAPKFLDFLSFFFLLFFCSTLSSLIPVGFFLIYSAFPSFYSFITKSRPLLLFIILFLSAIISPAEFFSFLLFAIPSLLLFEVTFFFLSFLQCLTPFHSRRGWVTSKRRARKTEGH